MENMITDFQSQTSKDVNELTSQIENERMQIYDIINKPRHQYRLIHDGKKWKQICSSMWVIGDTLLSIKDYCESEFPNADGLKYIYLYGLLQSLFLQQDAITHLAEAFDITIPINERLIDIREIRNDAIGHPTKRGFKKEKYSFHFISRISIGKYAFSLLSETSNSSGTNIRDIEISTIIIDQLTIILELMDKINDELKAQEAKDKSIYKNDKLVNVFPESMAYLYEKISQGVHSPSIDNRMFGLQMAKQVRGTFETFKNKLEERGELPANKYLAFDLEEYFYALEQIIDFLDNNSSGRNEKDARIYCYYLRENFVNFQNIAEEYDEEYLIEERTS